MIEVCPHIQAMFIDIYSALLSPSRSSSITFQCVYNSSGEFADFSHIHGGCSADMFYKIYQEFYLKGVRAYFKEYSGADKEHQPRFQNYGNAS